jgi:SAM-dependent methyltransferase
MVDSAYADVALYVRAFQISRVLHVAAELGLADRIGDDPRPVTELAAESGAHPEKLLSLCRALASFGIFTVDSEGRVGHTPRSRYLRSDARPTLHYAARFFGTPGNWGAWGNLEHAVMTGESAFEPLFGMPNFEYLRTHPEEATRFDAFMQHSPDDRHAAVAAAYDFSAAGVVVDVGGGTGGLLRAILEAYPAVRGVLFDRENVVADAAGVLGPQAKRCNVVAGDFFTSALPAEGDVYTMSQILHDWSDERCLAILRNLRTAMKPGARLLVVERVLDGAGAAEPMNYLTDMQMMVLFPGAKERTLAEFAHLFRQSGFSGPRVVPTRSAFNIIETGPE